MLPLSPLTGAFAVSVPTLPFSTCRQVEAPVFVFLGLSCPKSKNHPCPYYIPFLSQAFLENPHSESVRTPASSTSSCMVDLPSAASAVV